MGTRFTLRDAFRKFTRMRTFKFTIPNVSDFHIRLHSSDDLVFKQIFQDRQYDLAPFEGHRALWMKHYKKICDRNATPLILDLGANNGASAAWFASQFPGAHVVAVEPDPGNYAVLVQNVNSLPNITTVHGAIGARHGKVSLSPSASREWGVRSHRDAEGEIEVFSIAEVANTEIANLFMVKVDIEGFEDDLFSSALDWIDHVGIIIVEPHDWMLPGQGSSANFQSAIGSRHFDLLISGENLVYIRTD